MPDLDDRLTAIEVALAHQQRLAEELSEVVREQATRLDRSERRLAALVDRLEALEANPAGAGPASVRPPHW